MNNLQKYDLGDIISKTKNSIIYRGIDQTNQSKIIKYISSQSPIYKSLKKEFNILKSLLQSNLISYLDSEENRDGFYIITEDTTGLNLSDYLKKNKLTLYDKLVLLTKITSYLEKLHSIDIIHRDIKPLNILVDQSNREPKIIDFGSATRINKEELLHTEDNSINIGTLYYISPEQTGRINRLVDYRTDIYSLGISFYECLCGKLPFENKEPLELIHSHIAKEPESPHYINKEITNNLSSVILKCIAKDPEDRYQSLSGLRVDLSSVAEEYKGVSINNFVPGSKDYSPKFQIPQKIYGREKEFSKILDSIHSTSLGIKKIVSITGESGIGKTFLIGEVQKNVSLSKGMFISGKFDLYTRGTPYSAILTGLKNLVNNVLSYEKSYVDKIISNLKISLGENAGVLTELIPEMELLLGKCSHPIALPPTETKNRIHLIFKNLLQTFSKQNHPLIFFLDDLQWADAGSLNLIEVFFSTEDLGYFTLIISFRDNEIKSNFHALNIFEKLKTMKYYNDEIQLTPLNQDIISLIISETLKIPSSTADELSSVVYDKTKGNPFYINSFLKSLFDNKYIRFKNFSWDWDINELKLISYTDNIYELIKEKINKQDEISKHILDISCFLGDDFEKRDLKRFLTFSEDSIDEKIISLVNDEFFIAKSETLKFSHDKIRETIYSYLTPEFKNKVHLEIGRNLLQNFNEKDFNSKQIFTLLDHLNKVLIELSPKEKEEVFKLNLEASKKAKNSTAYDSSVDFLKKAKSLLSEDIWNSDRQKILNLYYELAESTYLSQNYKEAEEIFNYILEKAESFTEKIKIYSLKIDFFTNQTMLKDAISIGLQALNEAGIQINQKPGKMVFIRDAYIVKKELKSLSLDDILNKPKLTDPLKISVLQIILKLIPPTYIANPNLFTIITLKMLRYSIENGMLPISCYSFICYSLINIYFFNDIKKAILYEEVAWKMVEATGSKLLMGKICYHVSWVSSYRSHITESLDWLEKGIAYSQEVSDYQYLGFDFRNYFINSFYSGMPLTELDELGEKLYKRVYDLKNPYSLSLFQINIQIIKALLGTTKNFTSLSNENYNEEEVVQNLKKTNNMTGLCLYGIGKMILFFLMNDHKKVVETALEIEPLLDSIMATPPVPIFYFFFAISICTSNLSKEKKFNQKLYKIRRKYKVWSEHNPKNYLNKKLLIDAVYFQTIGNFKDAAASYDKAIYEARKNKFIQEEAISCNLAANFYKENDCYIPEKHHRQEAHSLFLRWGCSTVSNGLAKEYHYLINSDISENLNSEYLSKSSQVYDIDTILKSSSVLTEELNLEKLIEKIMINLMETSGAERVVLFLNRDDNLYKEAELFSNSKFERETKDNHFLNYKNIPTSILNYTIRAKETVLINDIRYENRFSNDEYIASHTLKSLLAFPLLEKNSYLAGILYFENNLIYNAFTLDRINVLNILANQIVISLENSKLYSSMQMKEKEYRTLIESLNTGVFRSTIEGGGNVIHANSTMLKMFGFSSLEDMQSIKMRDLYADNVSRKTLFKILNKEGSCRDVKLNVKRKDNSGFIASMSASFFKTQDGLLFLDGIIEDITDKIKLEEEKEQYLNKIQAEKIAAVGQIVSGAAHELNTPLGAIKASANNIIKSQIDLSGVYYNLFSDLEPESLKMLSEFLNLEIPPTFLSLKEEREVKKKIRTELVLDGIINSEELASFLVELKVYNNNKYYYPLWNHPKSNLIVSLLEKSRGIIINSLNIDTSVNKTSKVVYTLKNFEAKDSKGHSLRINLKEDIENVLTIYDNYIKNKITVKKLYKNVVPFYGFSDLVQVWTNIIFNSLQALKGNGEICITIDTLENKEDFILVTIEDNGPGIPEENQSKIYEPFFTTKASGEGSGLGLYLSKKIIQRHKGEISFQSTLGKTVFSIKLPIKI